MPAIFSYLREVCLCEGVGDLEHVVFSSSRIENNLCRVRGRVWMFCPALLAIFFPAHKCDANLYSRTSAWGVKKVVAGGIACSSIIGFVGSSAYPPNQIPL